MKASTKKCSQYGHPEVSMEYDPDRVPEGMIKDFVNFIEKQVASGIQYKSGQTLGFGWATLLFQSLPDGTLAVMEPDLQEMPMVWINSVTGILMQTLIQSYVAESLGLMEQSKYPFSTQFAVICDNLLACPAMIMYREKAWDSDPNDSGWRINCADSLHVHDASSLRLVSLYECAVNKPQIMEYLTLPEETALHVLNLYDELVVNYAGRPLSFSEESYLGKRVAIFAAA